MPMPVCQAVDTCAGVEAASKELGALVTRILAVEPRANIVLLGNSLGCLMTAYYAETAGAQASAHLAAIISLDAPLLGIDVTQLPADLVNSPRGPCPLDAGAWLDIIGVSGVIGEIADLGRSAIADRVFAINATVIGQAAPGTRW